MIIRICKIPFAIVILASITPFIAAYTDSKLVALMADLILIISAIILAASGKLKLNMSFMPIVLLLILLIHSVLSIIDGRGIGSGGIILFFIELFLFYKMLNVNPLKVNLSDIYKWISWIYIMHLIFLVFELLARTAGFTDFFVNIAGSSTVTSIYKTYNTAGLLFIYFKMSGLNSLLLGSQSASQLALFGSVWFLSFYTLERKQFKLSKLLILVIIFITMYVLSSTMTSNVLMLLIFMLFILFFNDLKLFIIKKWPFIFFIMIIFGNWIFEAIFFRINNEEDILIYLSIIESVLETLSKNISLYELIVGWGRVSLEGILSLSDFGIGALVIQIGLLMFVFLLWPIIYFVKNIFSIRKILNSCHPSSRLAFMATINGILGIAWLASLIHYTPAIELGGRQIFAFHIALTLLLLHKLKSPILSATV